MSEQREYLNAEEHYKDVQSRSLDLFGYLGSETIYKLSSRCIKLFNEEFSKGTIVIRIEEDSIMKIVSTKKEADCYKFTFRICDLPVKAASDFTVLFSFNSTIHMDNTDIREHFYKIKQIEAFLPSMNDGRTDCYRCKSILNIVFNTFRTCPKCEK